VNLSPYTGQVINVRFEYITDDAVEALFPYTKGIPRVVNIVCDKALLLGFVHGTHIIDKDIIEQSIEELEGQFSLSRNL